MPMTMGMLASSGVGSVRPTLLGTQQYAKYTNAQVSTSMTAPAGTKFVVVAISNSYNSTSASLSSISFGGSAMTAAVAYNQYNQRSGVGIYYIAGTYSGSYTLSISYSSNGEATQCAVYYFSTYNSATPIGVSDNVSYTTTLTPLSQNPFMIGCATVRNTSQSFFYTNMTSLYETAGGTSSFASAYNNTLSSAGATQFDIDGGSPYPHMAIAEIRSS